MFKKILFTKKESFALLFIFLVLIAVAIPNFMASLRRARNQVRRDDLGALQNVLADFYTDFGKFPSSSADGKIMACLAPGSVPTVDKEGHWTISYISCNWGIDNVVNVTNGKKYMGTLLSRDPDWQKGASYIYMSNGDMYQIYTAMEGKDEAEIDNKIISKKIMCGTRVCNVGRSFNCDTSKTLEECEIEANSLKK